MMKNWLLKYGGLKMSVIKYFRLTKKYLKDNNFSTEKRKLKLQRRFRQALKSGCVFLDKYIKMDNFKPSFSLIKIPNKEISQKSILEIFFLHFQPEFFGGILWNI